MPRHAPKLGKRIGRSFSLPAEGASVDTMWPKSAERGQRVLHTSDSFAVLDSRENNEEVCGGEEERLSLDDIKSILTSDEFTCCH